ncbi:MAG: CapA family protein [Termitinemataceae bacterium]|nr:MAG: CapA family protein [Termitinemataceae bacterium]
MRQNNSQSRLRILCVFFVFLLFDCATIKKYDRRTINIIAVGDNLIHKALITYAENETGEFNFKPFYRGIRDVVSAADIAFINQETLIAGEAFGYSGYPQFNGPEQIGDALIWTGFNVVNHASNHSMDKGEAAVFAVMDYWKTKKNITTLGIHRSEEERKKPRIIISKGVKIGFLSYTYGLNGMSLPDDKPWLVSLIDKKIMAKEIDALRAKCDFLIVSMHWGKEYEHTPNAMQEELAVFLAERGVDLVIGHHPHVLQPVRWIERKNGSRMLCYFSLGNLISAQNETPRMLGGMMSVKLNKTKEGAVYIKNYALIPLVTHYERDSSGFRVELLENYSNLSAERHALNRQNTPLTPEYFHTIFNSVDSFSD